MRHAPSVNAELPPRQCSGAISSISTEAPFSLADNAAQVAALPAPTTITSGSGMSIADLSRLHANHFSVVRRKPLAVDVLSDREGWVKAAKPITAGALR